MLSPKSPATWGRVEDTSVYARSAASIFASFHSLPYSTSIVDNWNAVEAVRQAIAGRSGARVVDLGCGGGACTRELALSPEVGLVLGVDYSPAQVALCRRIPHPPTCQFGVGNLVALGKGDPGWAPWATEAAAAAAVEGAKGDGGSKGGDDDEEVDVEESLGTFDVALMEFVTCHAGSQDDLNAFIRGAALFLAPGGQLIVVEGHPLLDRAPFPPSDKYAISKEFLLPAPSAEDEKEGRHGAAEGCSDTGAVVPSFTKIRTTFVTPKGTLSVEDFFHSAESWKIAVDHAGLVDLRISDVLAPPHPEPGFWDGYIRPDHPCGCAQTAVIRASKPK
jgi:SAM-dependent methyltransferase